MMRFDIMTLFPDLVTTVLSESIIGRAQKSGVIEVHAHNIRDYSEDKHRRVDDTPYGGGMGMLMAARLAEHVEGLDVENGLSERLEADMRACGLSVDCPFAISMMAEAMSKDKKAEGDKVHFVLPLSVGKVIIYDMTVSEACSLLEN